MTAGRIAAIGDLSQASAGRTIDCRGLHVLPGVIDTQVHFREPGATHKEDLEAGSLGAVMGGVTAVFEMPNTNPTTTDPQALADKVRRGHHRMHCDFAFFMGGTRENTRTCPSSNGCRAAAASRCSWDRRPARCWSTTTRACATSSRRSGGGPRSTPRTKTASTSAKFIGSRAIRAPTRSGATRSRRCAARERLVALARETGRRVHVLHITTAQEMAFLKDHKDVASVEVTPHHLTLEAPDCYERLGTLAQMNPPVRGGEHRAAIWHGLQQGVVDVLGSDHAPHTRDEKAATYPATPSGMTGVQTLVPLMLDHVNAGRLSLVRFVDLTSAGPARLFGIARKGRIAAGYDADLTVVDLKRRATITNAWIKSRAGWTPYDGLAVTGWPIGTFVRGAQVMWDGELIDAARGEAVRFLETLAPQ